MSVEDSAHAPVASWVLRGVRVLPSLHGRYAACVRVLPSPVWALRGVRARAPVARGGRCAACVHAHAHPASLVFRLSPRVECALQEDKAVALSAALPAWDSARDLVCTL